MRLTYSQRSVAVLPANTDSSFHCPKATLRLQNKRFPLLFVVVLAACLTALAQSGVSQASLERAATLIGEKRLVEADQEVDRILKVKPNNAAALNLKGTIRAQQGKLDEAENLFMRALQLDSQLPGLHMNLAHLYLLKGETVKTIAELREVLVLEPTNSEAIDRLAALLLSEGKPEDCINVLARAKLSQPLSPAQLILLGDAYLQKHDPDKAEENYQQALDAESDNTDAILGLAQVAQQRGRMETARSYLMRSKTLAASSAATLYRFALVALRAGNPEEANAAMVQATKLQPNDDAYFLLLGTTWLQKPDLVEAEKAFRRSLQLKPNNPQSQMSLGYALLMQKQYPEAKLWLEKSVALDSHTPETFYYLGLIAQEQNEDEQAIQFFKKSLELLPSFGHAHIALGSTYLKLKNYSLALAELEEGVRLNPDDSKAHYTLAVLYARLKDQQRAQEQLDIVERLKIKNTDSSNNRESSLPAGQRPPR
jgi:protein O-GlcNAc transferase